MWVTNHLTSRLLVKSEIMPLRFTDLHSGCTLFFNILQIRYNNDLYFWSLIRALLFEVQLA